VTKEYSVFHARGVELRRVLAWLSLSAAGCLLTSQAAFGAVYCSNPGLAIPNPGSTSDDLVIGAHLTITDLNVRIVASHTWVGDLSFSLEKVVDGGAVVPVTLMNRPGVPASLDGCGLDNVDLILDDEATNGPIENACETPLGAGGPYTPDSPLSSFDGVDIGGTWRFHVSDAFPDDAGTLSQWCLITLSALDVDGDGEFDALTDGILILRYKFDFTGAILINGAVDVMHCTRCTADAIKNYLDDLP
jgi:hypothetical protein